MSQSVLPYAWVQFSSYAHRQFYSNQCQMHKNAQQYLFLCLPTLTSNVRPSPHTFLHPFLVVFASILL